MYPEAYKEWLGIFNDDILEIWQKERKELKKVAMLLTAFQKELKDVQTNLEVELVNLKQQFKCKDDLKERRKSFSPKNRKRSPKAVNNENQIPNLETILNLPAEDTCTQKESPDLFRNINLNILHPPVETSVIDLSISDEDTTEIDGSPTIKRRRTYRRGKTRPPSAVENKIEKLKDTPLNKIKTECLVKANLFKTPMHKSDDDFSVIEGTPEVTIPRQNTGSKIGSFSSNKARTRSKRATNNTLTQMFGKLKQEHQTTTNRKLEHEIDSDETYCEETTEGSKMGITDMLSYINKDETKRDEKSFLIERDNDVVDYGPDTDSNEEVDQFSKGAIFNETDIATPNEEQKLIPLEPEPVVRGKARRQLKGWACQQCKNFYGQMKLSPEELQKKLDECSRHKYKYRPPEDTPPGFWDLTIPPQKPD